jgi:predicted DNA-binding protein
MKEATMIRVNILLPDKLKEEVKKINKKQNTNFSYFVREATKEHLNRVKKEILEKELIEQCKETAKLNLEICDEFKYVDGENL